MRKEFFRMSISTFFGCPNCGNTRKFKIFVSTFQVIEQSPRNKARTNKSGVLPNLRTNDNYVECQYCLRITDYDKAVSTGKKHLEDCLDFEQQELSCKV